MAGELGKLIRIYQIAFHVTKHTLFISGLMEVSMAINVGINGFGVSVVLFSAA